MYAAAGGASLASRQARRKENKKHHVISSDAVHQQFQRRFQQLHQEHARLYQTDLNGRIPAHDLEGKASAAWSERDRRGSTLEYQVAHGRVKASDSHRKWTRRNRIHDSSYGGSSSDEEEGLAGGAGAAGRAEQSAAANALLYVGLGTVAIGLVIAFVGTGEKGFKTLELRLIGPTLIAGGLLCCLLRILLCVCPSRCPWSPCYYNAKRRGKRGPPDHDYYRHLPYRGRTANDFLLAEQPPPPAITSSLSRPNANTDKKRVSIVQTPGAIDRRPLRSSTWRGGPRDPLPDLVGAESPVRSGGVGGFQAGADSVELLELRGGCGRTGGGAFDELHSASSEDSFNGAAESLALVEAACSTSAGCSDARKPTDERLARLKSTLTFQDDVDDYEPAPQPSTAAASTCPRIDEEREDEMTSSHSTSPQPQLPPPPHHHHPPHQSSSSTLTFARRELVLSPAKLQNI